MHTTVAGLLADKLIVPKGTAASRGGRRASQYYLASDIGCVGSISIRLNHLEVGIFDLTLQPLVREELPVAMDELGPETYTGKAVQMLESCIAKLGLPREKILGVGVTLPGPVDFRTGVVQQLCRAPKWQQFPIAERLRQSLNCPIVVDKDAYAVLDLLAQTGKVNRTDSCAYLAICEGIGSALMINGQVFRGGHSLAGEIGHLTVNKHGLLCPCGNTGCLELYCSDIGIVQQYNEKTGQTLTGVSEVVALSEQNDPAAIEVLTQAIGYLVDTTSTMIMTYDPQELLIFCTWLRDPARAVLQDAGHPVRKIDLYPETRGANPPDGAGSAEPERRRGDRRAQGAAGNAGHPGLTRINHIADDSCCVGFLFARNYRLASSTAASRVFMWRIACRA